jgi:hypothetical protein
MGLSMRTLYRSKRARRYVKESIFRYCRSDCINDVIQHNNPGSSEKVADIPNKDDLELSSITLTGNFSQNDILNWISKCLPNVPKIQEGNEMTLCFRSTFIGTYLIVSLGNQT